MANSMVGIDDFLLQSSIQLAPNNRFDRDCGDVSIGKVGRGSMIEINELRSASRSPRRGQPER
jgi:hypothetical protein